MDKKDYIKAAVEIYSDDLECNVYPEEAQVTEVPGEGACVSAWVFVLDEEAQLAKLGDASALR